MQAQPYSENLQKTVEKIFSSNRISRTEHQFFMTSILSQGSFNSDEENLINKVLDKLSRGLIQTVD